MLQKNKKNKEYEKKTVKAMIKIYCHAHHQHNGDLCPECQKLYDYAKTKIDRCRFKNYSMVCSECSVHCFQAEKRESIRKIMRFSGPGMIWNHPVMAIRYLRKKIMSKKKNSF